MLFVPPPAWAIEGMWVMYICGAQQTGEFDGLYRSNFEYHYSEHKGMNKDALFFIMPPNYPYSTFGKIYERLQ